MSTGPLATEGLLVLPHLRIQNANAISSPLTHGFPSVTAWAGLAWAVERKLASEGIGLSLVATGVVSHAHQEQVTPGYVNTFRLTRNPVDKDGGTAAIVEEGRVHLDITLVFAVVWNPEDTAGNIFGRSDVERQALAARIADIVATSRVAGGTILPQEPAPGRRIRPQLLSLPEDADERARQFRRLRRQWLPGFALVGRDDLLDQRWQEMNALDASTSRLDAWLDLARFNWRPKPLEASAAPPPDGKVEWHHDRPQGSGWIVPIPVGYGALSELFSAGSVRNARDETTDFRFVESLYSIGQWISPHHLTDVDQLLWYVDTDPVQGHYRVRNDFPNRMPNPSSA